MKITFSMIIFLGTYGHDRCYAMFLDEMTDTVLLQRRLEQEIWFCYDSTHGLSKTEHCPICASRYRQNLNNTKNTKKILPTDVSDKHLINKIKSENDYIENILLQWEWMGDVFRLLGYYQNNPF